MNKDEIFKEADKIIDKHKSKQLNKPVVIGSFVRFYDCQTANAEKDYSGANPKHYPIGKVIAVYDYKSYFGYTDRLCDIQVGERISKGHFVTGVDVVS
tara:strand:+ start:282 stop:575 length:294 start_codon:yes stop_codon:yes gene_type:complete